MQDFLEQAREIVGAQQAALTSRGTSLHGWATGPVDLPTVEETAARLEREAVAYAAFKATPTGRFVTAAKLIFDATGDERLLQCWTRGLDTNADFAAKLLSEMEGPAADQARAALANWRNA